MGNIIEINQMIDYIDDFVNNGKSQDRTIIGGIAGTNLCRSAIESVMSIYDINKLCIIEGCQDYIGLDKEPIINHLFYGDIFYDVMCNPLNGENIDPFKPNMFNPKHSYAIGINMGMINNYDFMIINDAHLIPDHLLMIIDANYGGKILMVVDPYDIGGEKYSSVYTVNDTLYKISPMLALARSAYNVDTRSINIDKKFRGMLHETHITRRTIGKIDDKQYISNDILLCDIIRSKQLDSKIRKNHKMFVTSNKINIRIDKNTNKRISLPYGSIVTIQSNAVTRLYMKCRLYSSKTILDDIDVTYFNEESSSAIQVKPANILNINESHLHRYKHTVLVMDDEPISDRQKYSILKNSLEVTLGYIKK